MRWRRLRRIPTRLLTAVRWSWMLICLLAAGIADAEPMKLDHWESRWVGVRFEVSPSGRPGQRDTVYTQRFTAWLEPDPQPDRLRVTINAEIVEQHLMREQRPVPGSFSDFVWVFDVRSGEVLSAQLRGRLIREVGWGPFRSEVETAIAVDMNTIEPAGYEMPRRLFSNTIFPYCGGASPASDCTLVTPSAYQQRSGYVNAVGDLAVDSPLLSLHTFSPLGEAVFSELSPFPGWPDPQRRLARPTPLSIPASQTGAAALAGDNSAPLGY